MGATGRVLAAALLAVAGAASAQTFTEGFDDVAALPATGWLQVNTGTAPTNPWFQGNPDVFPSAAGAADAYAGADFLSSFAGPIDNWLITPALSIAAASELSFATRSAGNVGFADVLEILFSPGNGTALGGFVSLGTFGVTAAYPTVWTLATFALPDVSLGRIAFRQRGTAETADYVGIDSVRVTLAAPIPEPETYALFAAGLGGLAWIGRRRRAAPTAPADRSLA
jgi:hypothetical protein